MKNWEKYFEALNDDVADKLSEKNKSLKKGLIDLIDQQLGDKSTELGNVQNFIGDVLDETEVIEGLVENSDIFEFYLKYQADIDSLLSDENFFDESPKSNNVYSLYDFVIEGTKIAVSKSLELIKEEIFK